MIGQITLQLMPLFGSQAPALKSGISALAAQFELITHVSAGEHVWVSGEEKPILFFNGDGVLAEFSSHQRSMFCQRIIPPNTLFWSESSFLLWQKTDTYMRCKKASKIYGVSGHKVREITAQYGMGYILANTLTKMDIASYRNRSKDLCLLLPVERLRKTIQSSPQILSSISRDELAKYLRISRSSLFRAMNSLHDA